MVSTAMFAVMCLKAETFLEIKGMHCNSCARTVENILSRVDGVEKASVDFLEEKASVVFDSEKTSLEKIENTINEAGYSIKGQSAGNSINPKKAGLKQGILFGIVPHIGCIGFIAASILGVTFATDLFKPLLLSPWFFQGLIALSLVFATIASAIYLKSNGILSWNGLKRKKAYLATMYCSTIGVNLIFFFLIFPLTANFAVGGSTIGNVLASTISPTISTLKLQVSIPCSGHAPLISGELKKISGVTRVNFSSPNFFDVSFDATKTSKEQILSLDVFKTYSAKIVSESIAATQKIGLEGAGKPQPVSSGLLPAAASSCGCGAKKAASVCGCGS